jgi:hypothetical protein
MRIEGKAGESMAEEKPAAQLTTRMKGDNNLGSHCIERAPEQFALRMIARLVQMSAIDKMSL